MSGTGMAYGRRSAVLRQRRLLRARAAMSGTDIAYAATRGGVVHSPPRYAPLSHYGSATRCPVLR
eukprot:2875424-Rhodomonas_salina.1